MGDTDDETGQHQADWGSSDTASRFIPFNLNDVEWIKVKVSPTGEEFHGIPESLVGKVDFGEYHDFGLWTAYIDAGNFNLLGVKLAANFTIPRHHHNMDQLVMVHEGEVWQGNRCFVPGDAYFTRAGHPYSITAGPDGATVFEIRSEPLAELTLVWDEANPDKWVHGRRPGGPAASMADTAAES